MNLTPKQEKFANLYIELGNASEAYRQSYNAENMGNDTIYVKACELLKSGKVKVRVDELRDSLAQGHKRDLEYILKGIEGGIEMAKKKEEARTVIAGFKEVGEFLGLKTEKHEHSGGLEIIVNKKS